MKKINDMKEALICKVEAQMQNLDQINTKELKDAIEAIHYLEEVIYYATITKSMEKSPYSDIKYYSWPEAEESRTSASRKMYMKSKMSHKDKTERLKDLETYIHDLSDEVVDMIKDSSPEEK